MSAKLTALLFLMSSILSANSLKASERFKFEIQGKCEVILTNKDGGRSTCSFGGFCIAPGESKLFSGGALTFLGNPMAEFYRVTLNEDGTLHSGHDNTEVVGHSYVLVLDHITDERWPNDNERFSIDGPQSIAIKFSVYTDGTIKRSAFEKITEGPYAGKYIGKQYDYLPEKLELKYSVTEKAGPAGLLVTDATSGEIRGEIVDAGIFGIGDRFGEFFAKMRDTVFGRNSTQTEVIVRVFLAEQVITLSSGTKDPRLN